MINAYAIPMTVHNMMNTDHAEEVKLLNYIEWLMDSKAPETILSKALESYFEHIRMHAANEEKMMREVCYPAYKQHKIEHRRMLNGLKNAILDWRATKQIRRLRKHICRKAPIWLNKHICKMDTVAADYIAASKRH